MPILPRGAATLTAAQQKVVETYKLSPAYQAQLEREAAAAATKNSVVRSRAAKAANDLRNGQPLAKALRRFDRRADLAWRVENAGHGSATFRETLEGWTNHLSALAYKQQQSAFYYAFTFLTLLNGLCVLGIAMMFFLPLIKMIEGIE